jgi:hypothetical protein
MALLSQLPGEAHLAADCGAISGGIMLDMPKKTDALLSAMTDALPFEVELSPAIVAHLARQQKPLAVKPLETVSNVSYAGDEGGIMCHIELSEGGSMVVASLTHVRVPRTLPFAAAVIDYQKHRVKKIRKQQARGW